MSGIVSDVEAAVLGAALLSPVACAHAVTELVPDDFVREAHRTVFGAIVALKEAGSPVDAITVTSHLGTAGLLDSVGGPVALSALARDVPNPSSAKFYVQSVRDVARRDRARKAALKFAEQVSTTDDVSLAVEQLATLLTSSSSARSTVDPEVVKQDFYRRLADEELVKSWRSGWRTIDAMYRLPEGMLTVVTGLPSSGKSTFLDVLLWRICAEDDSFKATFFSPEQGPPGKHLYSLVHTSLGQDPRRCASDVVEGAREWWQGRVDWIDEDSDSNISDVLAVARVKASQGCRLLIVDPYNNLADDSRKFDRQDLEIRSMLRRLKRFARETGVSVVVVAHPRQMPVVAGTEAVFQIPTAGHIAGGQEWWNLADAILCVWRNQSGERPQDFGDPSQVKVVVQKVRDAGLWGRQGSGVLVFDEVARRYVEVLV